MLKEINTPSDINIAMDVRFNSVTTASRMMTASRMTTASRKQPGQNASHAVAVACETMTDKKFVIHGWFMS